MALRKAARLCDTDLCEFPAPTSPVIDRKHFQAPDHTSRIHFIALSIPSGIPRIEESADEYLLNQIKTSDFLSLFIILLLLNPRNYTR